MSQGKSEQQRDRRLFPRIIAECPVLYRTNDQERWCVGVLQNFSATGILMSCNRALKIGSPISLYLERGRNRSIPALRGSGIVMRSDNPSTNKYVIACKLTQIDLPDNLASPQSDTPL